MTSYEHLSEIAMILYNTKKWIFLKKFILSF